MPGAIDEVCPPYVGEAKLVLALGEDTPTPRALAPVDVTVDYAGAGADGVVLPLEMTIVGPSRSSFVRRFFKRTAPTLITFVPKEGGRHLVRLGELGHNRWFGALRVDVRGEETAPR